MESDQEIYNKIGLELSRAAPSEAKIIIMLAFVDELGDAGKFEYDFINDKGEASWLVVGGEFNSMMLDLIILLRQYFVGHGQPFWNGCKFTVDVENGKFSVEFKY